MSDRFPEIKADRVPSSLTLRDDAAGAVQIEAASQDGKKLARFSMTAYNGGTMNVGFGLPVVVDLAGVKVSAKSRPILLNHDPDRIVGHTDDIKIEAGRITARGVISGTSAYAREVIENGANGFPWQASIGANPDRMMKVEAGESVSVNGKTFKGPLYVAARTNLNEISFVPLGADDSTHAKVAASAAGHYLETHTMNFKEWLKARGHDINKLSEDQRKLLQATFDAEQKIAADLKGSDGDKPKVEAKTDDKPKPAKKVEARKNDSPEGESDEFDARKAVDEIKAGNAERDRIAAIERVCGEDFAEIKAKAIENKWDETRTELEVLRAKRPTFVVSKPQDANTRGKVIEAALLLASGLPEKQVSEQFDEKTIDAATGSEYRGMGLHGVMHECIRAAGGHAPAGRVDNGFIRAAFEADNSLKASGFTTLSLTGVLGAVANKTLLAAYRAVNLVGERIAHVEPNVADFKATNRYRLTATGAFSQVGPDGEIKHIGLSDETYTNQLETEAAMIALTRQTMINDDLGAFLAIPRMLGRKAALSKEKAIFETLLGNAGSFFAAGNNNYFDGASSALAIDSVTTGEQMLMDQTDSNGDPLLVAPKFILVPTSLKVTAEQIYKDTLVNETTTANKPKPTSNPHVNKFEVIASPYLNAQSLSGSSSTAWYIFADPNDIPVIEIAYLRGRQVPVIESAETSFNTLGMQWRAYQDFGVALQDTRGAVMSKGAA